MPHRPSVSLGCCPCVVRYDLANSLVDLEWPATGIMGWHGQTGQEAEQRLMGRYRDNPIWEFTFSNLTFKIEFKHRPSSVSTSNISG